MMVVMTVMAAGSASISKVRQDSYGVNLQRALPIRFARRLRHADRGLVGSGFAQAVQAIFWYKRLRTSNRSDARVT